MNVPREKILTIGIAACVIALLVMPIVVISHQEIDRVDLASAFCSPGVCGVLGKGENGIDLFSHIGVATQVALLLSLLVCLTSLVIGVALGVGSGIFGGWYDHAITLLTNLFLSFPSMLIAIALSVFWGNGFWSTWFVLVISGWASFCRISRAATLQVITQDYLTSARAIGCTPLRTALRHIVPNIFPIIVVHAAFQLSGIILIESTLSFLGIGLPQETPSLGRLVYTGKQVLLLYPHAALVPGIMVLILVIGFYVLGMTLNRMISNQEA